MRTLLVILLSVVLVGCASSGNKLIAKESAQSVKDKIQKGSTTKTDITKLFGKPNSVTLNSDSKETWVYVFSKAKIHGSTFIPFYGMFKNGSNVSVKQIVIVYDGDTVIDYTMSETNSTVQSGLAG